MNLDKRQDRWNGMLDEFKRVGMRASRYRADTENDHGGNRFLAYNFTYHGILKSVSGNVLVLEDDVRFVNGWPRFESAISELPPDWDVFYLGANLNGTFQERYTDNLSKIKNSLQTHAVGYSDKMRAYIVENFDPNTFPIYDEWLRVNVQEKFNCFVMRPMIAEQAPGYSDLWEVHADYRATFRDGNFLL